MVDTAARLTDEILPAVPVRQWVLSMPFEIRYRLAWDGDLVSAVLAVFLRVVYGWYRRQSKKQGHGDGRCGSVTFVQRFGAAGETGVAGAAAPPQPGALPRGAGAECDRPGADRARAERAGGGAGWTPECG